MPKSTYLDNIMLNAALNNVAFSPAPSVYVALFTVAPTAAGGGTEVTGGSYARQAVTWTTATTGSVSNSVAITFPTATAAWGSVVAFAVFDALTAGNMLYFGNLGASRTVSTGDQVQFPIGQLLVTEQ